MISLKPSNTSKKSLFLMSGFLKAKMPLKIYKKSAARSNRRSSVHAGFLFPSPPLSVSNSTLHQKPGPPSGCGAPYRSSEGKPITPKHTGHAEGIRGGPFFIFTFYFTTGGETEGAMPLGAPPLTPPPGRFSPLRRRCTSSRRPVPMTDIEDRKSVV